MTPNITLADAITALVAEKRAVGFKYAAEERVLARLPRSAAASSPDRERLLKPRSRRGSRPPGDEESNRRPCRPWPRRSGSWPVGWAAGACPAYVLPAGALPRPARYVPHIYTDQEPAALFAQTDRCCYCSQVPLRHLVMPVLFRTIYACGLRASEARLLRVDDVDIDAGVLQIRDAKGGKDRQAPVCAPLRVRLTDYHAHVVGRSGGDWFFPGRAGRPLTLGNIDKNFRRFLWQARISHGGRGHGPRVHDLRHILSA